MVIASWGQAQGRQTPPTPPRGALGRTCLTRRPQMQVLQRCAGNFPGKELRPTSRGEKPRQPAAGAKGLAWAWAVIQLVASLVPPVVAHAHAPPPILQQVSGSLHSGPLHACLPARLPPALPHTEPEARPPPATVTGTIKVFC